MTTDRTTPEPPDSPEGLADASVGTSRRPAGARPTPGEDRQPSTGTPQGKPVANEQIPKD